jgi:hypothetical protein
MPFSRRLLLAFSLAVVVVGASWFTPARQLSESTLPKALDDSAFWQIVERFSEPGGFFRSDNFVSNEWDFQFVIPELKEYRTGGIYLGVGPDQNFTYVVALQPSIAFIVDIRRQNMIQHLMYKALLEMSANRADFVSRLFSRPRPDGLGDDVTSSTLFEAYLNTSSDRLFFEKNLREIEKHLTVNHRFKLSEDDRKSLEYIYTAFFEGGPDLTYSFSAGQGASGGYRRYRGFAGPRGMPTYAQLMTRTDNEGHNRSYLASEEHFQILRDLQKRNLIVPLVGDFAGPKALRAIGDYLKEHDATVTAFYTSNVEQYLFQQGDDWNKFYGNVAALPLDPQSTFIRSVASGRRYLAPSSRASLLCPIDDLLRAFRSERIDDYSDVIRMSH